MLICRGGEESLYVCILNGPFLASATTTLQLVASFGLLYILASLGKYLHHGLRSYQTLHLGIEENKESKRFQT